MKLFTFPIICALFLTACGPFAAESPSENLITPIAPEASNTDTSSSLLIWQGNDTPCNMALFSYESVSIGECAGALLVVPDQVTDHTLRLDELINTYTSFTEGTRAGHLTFRGSGILVPSQAEKRSIAEWAKSMFEVAQAGRADASSGLAFTWHRDAGAGDFCDDVVVYLSGWVRASDCKGYDVHGYLTASQLEQLYAWVDGFASIDYAQTYPASTNGLTLALTLVGNGQDEADEETIRNIFEFAADLYVELGYAAEVEPEVSEARQVLQDYLIALQSGDYAQAAKLYGGETDLLQTWNPDIQGDLPALFERACKQNGLRCLAPRLITYRTPDSDGGYHFYVEFNNPDYTLFEQGPCCGETGGSSISTFPFYVEKSSSGSGFLVTDLPPYVP